MSEHAVRVLAVDGGGVRGILPARVLTALEEMTGRATADMFDVLIGTSIGGIGVLALARPGDHGRPACSAADLLDFFTERAPEIFPQPSIDWPRSLRELEDLIRRPTQSVAVFGFNREIGNARYSPAGLHAALHDCLGEAMLGDALVDVVVTSYDVRGQSPLLFSSADVRTGAAADRAMVSIGMATAAAPTYFPAVEIEGDGGEPMILVDGGVYASSPGLMGFVEGVRLARDRGLEDSAVEVVSLGTGRAPERPELTQADFAGKSWYKLAQAIFEAAQAGQSALNDAMLGSLLGERYWRFDSTPDEGASMAMDDSTADNLAALHRLGDALVARRIGDLHRLAAHLGASPSRRTRP